MPALDAKAHALALLEQVGETVAERAMLPVVRERLRADGALAAAFARSVDLVDEGLSPVAARLVAWFEHRASTRLSPAEERELYGLTARERADAAWEAEWLRDMRALAADSPTVRTMLVEDFPAEARALGLLPRVAPAPRQEATVGRGGMPL